MTGPNALLHGVSPLADAPTAPSPVPSSAPTTTSPGASTGSSTSLAPGEPVWEATVDAITGVLSRRGFFTSEWWISLVGIAVTAGLTFVHVPGPQAAKIVALAGPVVVAAVYAIVRGIHKSSLTAVLKDLFPDYTNQSV